MWNGLLGAPGTAGLVTGLAYLGAVVALAVTGHISGTDALAALSLLGGGATAVTATHVAGNAITKANTLSAGTGVAPQSPAPAPVSAVPGPGPAAGQPVVTV